MIRIPHNPTADTRTCDYSTVTKDQLLAASQQHINDVQEGLKFFSLLLYIAAKNHDTDKLTEIDHFHADFVTGFKETGWRDAHRQKNRHHLLHPEGIPADVNLIDVLEFIADCVMAGMARSGDVRVREMKLPPEVLERAFYNTVGKLLNEVEVIMPREWR